MSFSLGGFGASKPAFSFGGTTAATTAATGFGTFGAPTSTAPSGFGTFGTAANTGNAFGTLGAAPASTAPSLFAGGGFGTAAAKPATGFGTGAFGTTGFGTATSGFGTGTSAFGSTAPTFGTNTLGTTGTGLFGTTPAFGAGTALGAGTSTFGTGAFGTGFGAKPAAPAFGGFGTSLGTTSAFGQQQLQQQQQQHQQQQQQQMQQGPTADEVVMAAVFNCQVFGDERDHVLAKWNLLQAQWGTGKVYYNSSAPPLELSQQNPLCRFKAIGYSRLSAHDDKDGLVSLLFLKKEQEIKSNQQQLVASLAGLLGNKPNLTVHIDSVKAFSENKTQVIIYVAECAASGLLGAAPAQGAGAGGAGARVSAAELAGFLNSASPRASLATAACSTVAPVTRASSHALQLYLENPPPGMDKRLWKQAQADNPDPENYVPVPIVGFSEIKWRTRCQAEETALQAEFLRKSNEKLSQLRTKRAVGEARLQQLAANLHRLQHTLLQVVCRQEVVARAGSALAPEEEAARARLYELAAQLAAPPLYNGRLNELLSAVRLQRSASAGAAHERYHLDPGAQEDMKQFLLMQQKGMSHLMETAKADLAALNTITDGMARLVPGT